MRRMGGNLRTKLGSLYLFASVTFILSCQRAMDWSGAPDIQATVEVEPETKTSLSVNSSGTGTVYWNPADKIDVFFGTKKVTYTSQNSSEATAATFKTSSFVSGSDVSSTNIWGLYPSNSSSTCNGSAITTTLPSTQYGVPNTFDDDLFPAIAHSTSTSLQFYNVCGGIKFSLYRDDIKSITFRGNNNEYLAGNIRLTFASGQPKATVVSGAKEITLTPKQGQTFAPNVDYYIVTLPVTLSRGFEITFLTTDGTIGTFNYTGSVTIKRSVFSKKTWIDSYTDDWAAPTNHSAEIYWSKKDYGDIEDRFEFTFEGGALVADSTALYKNVFNLFAMDQATFETLYPTFVSSYGETDPLGTVEYISSIPTLKWSFTAEQLWQIVSDPNLMDDDIPVIEHKVAFVAQNGARFVIILKAEVVPVKPIRITLDKYSRTPWIHIDSWDEDLSWWDIEYTFTRFAASLPDPGDTDSTNCIFHHNLNAPFVTDGEGVIDLTGISQDGLEVTDIKYFFCDDMEKITRIGNYHVAFFVVDGGAGETRTDVNGTQFCVEGHNTILKARIDGVETEIAYICNNAEEKDKTPNVIVLVKDQDPNHNAKKLLNTNQFYVLLGATGLIRGDERFEVNLWWQHDPFDPEEAWLDHFQANYIQPVKVLDNARDSFTDGVDFGQRGSFITLRDQVVLHDWLLDDDFPCGYREFGMKEGDPYYNFWEYYGPCKVIVDVSSIRCDLTPDLKVPDTIEIKHMSKAEFLAQIADPDAKAEVEAIDDGGCGFLTYRNYGPPVSDFFFYMPFGVQYGWGNTFLEDLVCVSVRSDN